MRNRRFSSQPGTLERTEMNPSWSSRFRNINPRTRSNEETNHFTGFLMLKIPFEEVRIEEGCIEIISPLICR